MIAKELHDRPCGDNPEHEDNQEINAVGKTGRSSSNGENGTAEALSGGARSEPRDLHPDWRLGGGELASEKELPGLFAAEFAAGGFGNVAWRDKLDLVRRQAKPLCDAVADRRCDGRLASGIGFARFGNDDEFFRAAC